MSLILEEKKRDVIPRWRAFKTAVAIGELKSSSKVSLPKPSEDFLISKIQDWKKEKNISNASELVGSSFVLEIRDIAVEAAEYLLAQNEGVTDTVKSIAQRVINPDSEIVPLDQVNDLIDLNRPQIYEKIGCLKTALQDEPRNSIAYVDLARSYTLLDQKEKAKNAINKALKLNSNDRFILRSAARFFVHIKELGRAHEILRKSEATKHDPWLLAAEIAIASAVGNTARFAKTGQRTLNDNNHSSHETSELATALGTLELENGKRRDARKLFKKALESPTENTIAQAEWISKNVAQLEFIDISKFEDVPLKHEAQAYENFLSGNWKETLEESWRWFYDQPFSTRPTALGGYVASAILSDYDAGIKIMTQGLISNPQDEEMLNNLAFSYASNGNVVKALETLKRIKPDDIKGEAEVSFTANEGLIAFRSGRIAEGRAKYSQAIEMSLKCNRAKVHAAARIFYAREELLLKSSEAMNALELAMDAASKINDNGFKQMIETHLSSATVIHPMRIRS